jgi:hypothetical protein
VVKIRDEASGLVTRLRSLNKGVVEVNKSIEKVRKAKQDRVKELESFVEGIQVQLSSQTDTKLRALESQQTVMNNEIKNLQEFQQKLNHQLHNEPRSKLIRKSNEIVR